MSKYTTFAKFSMEKRRLLSLLFIGAALYSNAQTGQSVYTFLNLPISARQAALGGDAVSIRDYDVSIAAVNPSLMNLEMDNRISIHYASYLADSKIGSIAYAKDFGSGHLVGMNVRYMDYGSMDRTDEAGNINGTFSASDVFIGANYAYQFEEDWTVGGSLGLITSKIDTYNSMALSATAAITYHNEEKKESLSLVARNFGSQIKTYNGTHERLPFRVDLGYTKILESFPLAFTITAHDLQQFNISQDLDNNGREVGTFRKIADHFSFGAELFPEKSFNIRLGYNIKRGNELAVLDQRNFSGLSAGFGIKISYFRFDYAHTRYHNASNMNMFGISLDIAEISGNKR